MLKTTRRQVIDDLRAAFLKMTDDDHSICEVAARQGLFCKGFSQWSFDELQRRYDWIVARRPDITRKELETLANAWQLARQEVLGTSVACDAQSIEHDTCHGWEEFTDEELVSFHRQLCGEEVEIIG